MNVFGEGVVLPDNNQVCTDCACRAFSVRRKLHLEDLILDIRSQLDTAETSFLNQKGWEYTSSTPDYRWRWVKTLDDGTKIMVSRSDALGIEGLRE